MIPIDDAMVEDVLQMYFKQLRPLVSDTEDRKPYEQRRFFLCLIGSPLQNRVSTLMIKFQREFSAGVAITATDVRKAAETASVAENDAAMHRLINRFLLHTPETSKMYYESKDVSQSIRASRELSRLGAMRSQAARFVATDSSSTFEGASCAPPPPPMEVPIGQCIDVDESECMYVCMYMFSFRKE